MKRTHAATVLALLLVSAAIPAQEAPSRSEVDAMMGLHSEGDVVRGQLDAVGFVVQESEAEEVVASAIELEESALLEQDTRLGMSPTESFIGGICPHDDHLYAGRVYVHLTERITAPRIILIGVFHKARLWDLKDRIVFDNFESWHGPWGDVAVDPIRAEILEALPEDSYLVDNTMHSREHSLEAIVPFLQRGNTGRTIVPILVPYMGWERIEELSTSLAGAISKIMEDNEWRLGEDLAIVVSSDAVHYGPDFDHSPFGTDAAAHEMAVERENHLAETYLEGPLQPQKIHDFLDTLVDPSDLNYRLPWCGRFSIPFGLEVLRKVALTTQDKVPEGALLRYGTSLTEPELPISAEARKNGLGYTAPSNFHHWVGYAAVGYTFE